MSINFTGPTSVAQLAERASSLIEDGNRLAVLASHLAEFEEATGRQLFVSEADQGTRYVGQGGQTTPDRWSNFEFSDAMKTPALGGELIGLRDPLAGCDCEPAPIAVPAPAVAKQDDPVAEAAPAVAKSADRVAPAPAPQHVSAPSTAPKAAPKAPAPAKPAPPAKQSLKAPTDRRWGALSLAERRIVQHVERLPTTFAPAEDLTLVEMLAHGNKIDVVAAFLEVEPKAALDRWKALMCDDVVGLDGKPTITGQTALLKALRYRAEVGV